MSFPDRSKTRPGTTRRVRLKDYDYKTPGYYFVTFCTYQRTHTLGTINKDVMVLSSPGEITDKFPDVSIDTFVIMPNHIHILVGLAVRLSDTSNQADLKDVVQWAKSTTHRRYVEGIRNQNWPEHSGKVW